jgi:putative transposase
MDVSDARRLKVLEEENSKPKKLLAEAMLDNAMLKDLNSKKF